MKRGLYVHIPFCLRKCHYCRFVITLDRSPAVREKFLSSLEQEITQAARQYGRILFDTLYLGGGTPSALSVQEMERLLGALRSHFDFKDQGELTCEVNPGDAGIEKLRYYRRLGINRISLGVQAFQEHLLQDMGRPHGLQEIEEILAAVRAEGFANVSLDFILRLPGQHLDDWKNSLDLAVRWGPGQFSLYDLEVHADTVYGARQRQGRLNLAEEPEHEQMMAFAETFLEEAGYAQYALSAFARPGFESRHNLIYWNNQEYLGLGPGAFSYLDGVRYQFAPTVARYFEKCGRADWKPDQADRLDAEKKELETLLTGLRLREGVDLSRFPLIRRSTEEKTAPLVQKGFLACEGERLLMTRKGRFVAESIFARLV